MFSLLLVIAGAVAGLLLGIHLSSRGHQCGAASSARSSDTADATPTVAAPDRTPFAAIAQATNDAVWDYDCARRRLWWSAHAGTLFGAEPSASLDEWAEGIHPDDRARVQARLQSVLAGQTKEWVDEYRYRRPDGTDVDLLDRGAALLDGEGHPTRLVGGLRDVTEQKLARAELRRINELLRSLAAQYRAVIDQSLAGIMVFQHGRFRYVNPKLADMCGAQPQALLAMPSALDSVLEEDRPHVLEALQKRMAGDLSGGPTRMRWKRPNGSITWGEVHGSRIEYEGAPALIGVAVDITDRHQAEERQQQLLEQLLAARERLQALSGQLMQVQEEERRQLARDLHDEIGQSLTALKMNLLSVPLTAPTADGTQAEASAAVGTASGSAVAPPSTPSSSTANVLQALHAMKDDSLKILDDLIAHVRNLSLDLRPAMLDDLGLPETLRWFVARQATRAGWTADVQIDEELSELPSALALTCFRIVQECVTNAMRHAHATRIIVHATRRDQAVHLDIRDNGAGFDVPSALQRSARGGSVGLLSLHERVRALSGELTLESAPEQGTAFHIRIPLSVTA